MVRTGVRAARQLEHKRFRAAYDFLVLRSRCGEVDPEIADWWTRVQSADEESRRAAFDVGKERQRKRRRRPRRHSRQNEPES
jgi:poly(A) polymerase